MKNIIKNKNILFAIFSLIALTTMAQVSISNSTPTSTPKGLIDLQNSTAGIIYPRFALTSNIIEAPVQNPDGSGSLVAGTVIYNTTQVHAGTDGENSVYPGIYAWNGSKWVTQFIREDSESLKQSSLGFRPLYSDGFTDIPGLGNGSSFTPKYSGTYRIKANVNFGAGEVSVDASHITSMATQEGYFRIILDGTNYDIYTHAYSVYNDDINSGTYFEQFRHDSSLILYVELVAGVPFSYRFQVNVIVSDNFVDSGNSGTGRAYVGIGLPCTIEFTYLEKN
ncbi:MAG: hypothetical protein KUG68_11165 [Flavobacteriaceae bacterium]|nr:hypothetical protein [Flavobacteriaceae bacterium]